MVKEIEHGFNILNLCRKLGLKVKFVKGSITIFKESKKTKNETERQKIKRIEKDKKLLEIIKKQENDNDVITNSDEREEIRSSLNKSKYDCVISTSVWREGVDIPNLDCVINACGGKSEIMTLQAIGRGLRKTDDKEEVIIIDFLDPYKYLALHTIQRLQIYVNSGWL